jgi:MoxR-like ATPase
VSFQQIRQPHRRSHSVTPLRSSQPAAREDLVRQLTAALTQVIRGTPEAIELLLVGALSRGHVLIEDVPGVGKTTLAKAFAKALGLESRRVQCTPDLLPSDILGTHILNPGDGTLNFRPGPVFTNVLLADEVNRASPRTQSALLEAMSEHQVTTDGETRALPEPFIVLATQNPIDFQGTYPLPEAQLDRFVLRFSLGYPDEESELSMLSDRRGRDPLSDVEQVATHEQLTLLMARVQEVRVEDRVARYLRALVVATREHEDFALGASPRATLVLYRACQARAIVHGRDYVLPDDVQCLALPVLAHRVRPTEHARYGGKSSASICADVLQGLAVPT